MLLTCNYLSSICYEQFVWMSPIFFLFLFSSVPFKMHNTSDHTQSSPTGNISGWARICEKGLCVAEDWLCLSERILPHPHTPPLWPGAHSLLRQCHSAARNLFSWGCTAATWHFAEQEEAHEEGRKGRLVNLGALEAWWGRALGQPASSKEEVMRRMALPDTWWEFICALSRSVPGKV